MYNPMYEPDKCMNRTNIYLDEGQARSLDEAARAQGISRAALIRRLIDRGLDQTDSDLESDLAAIEASFNVLSDEENFLERGTDDRSRHLDSVRGGR
jgi:Ribbon-helix-helix protein, copG family